MTEDTSEDYWMDDIIVQSKRKDHTRKTKKEIERIICVDDENKFRAFSRLLELEIPKSAKVLLTKLIANGQLTSVNKVLFRKKKSIIISGKVNQKHRNFPLLSTDDVIIKILINGNKDELWKRADDEFQQDKHIENRDNRSTLLLQTGNIIVSSMIGKDGKPAASLQDILNYKQRNISLIYNEVIEFWCKIRDRPFHPSNILYHDGKWWSIGHGGPHAQDINTHVTSSQLLSFYRTNLKHLIDLFCHYGLCIKEAEDGFMKYGTKYYWYTQQIMRGMTRKRSFFSIMYS